MTWLITGGSGQLGIALSRELDVQGHAYYSFGSQELDITQKLNIRSVVNQITPKVIVNCAAWTDVDGAEVNEAQAKMVNSVGVENIALAAKSCGARLIHISTDYIFSGDNHIPWKVNDVPAPQTAYGRSKAEGEKHLLDAYPENSWIVRTAWLYSPWGKNFAKTLTRLALSGNSEIRVVDDQTGQPTSAGDLAQQIVVLVSSNSPPGIYHGTNSGEATWYEFALYIFKLLGADVKRISPVASTDYPSVTKRPSYSVLSHDSWKDNALPRMRDWRTALLDVMPDIIAEIKAEG
jgi:dTDP-4-dehydrorhamnose reductase